MNMKKTRERIITEMCYAWRHDFGLDKIEGDNGLPSGMTNEERKLLWDQMAEVYDNAIVPSFVQPKFKDICGND
jgi:hypothetical protein